MIIELDGYSRKLAYENALSVLNQLYDLTKDDDAKYDIKVFDDVNDRIHEPSEYENGLKRLKDFAVKMQDEYLDDVCKNIESEIKRYSEILYVDLDSNDIEIINRVQEQLHASNDKKHILSCLNFDVPYQVYNNLYDFTKDSHQTRFKCELALNTLKDYSIVYKDNIDNLIKKFEEKL